MGEIAEADPADAELSVDRTRTAAPAAPRVLPDAVSLRPLLLVDQGLLSHY